MQPVARAESRTRRSASMDARPSRSRRSFNARTSPSSYATFLVSFVESISYFSTAALLYRHTNLPLPLLVFPAFFTALIAALLLSLPKPRLFRVVKLASPWLPRLATLHLAHVTALLLALRLVGPSRCLIVLGARAPLSRPLASPRIALLAVFALALLARDTSAPPQAARVATHFKRISSAAADPRRLVASLRRVATRQRGMHDGGGREGDSKDLSHVARTDLVRPQGPGLPRSPKTEPPPLQRPGPPPPPEPPMAGHALAGADKTQDDIIPNAGGGRRLLTIVKGEELLTSEQINGSEGIRGGDTMASPYNASARGVLNETGSYGSHRGGKADAENEKFESKGSAESVDGPATSVGTDRRGMTAVAGIVLATSSALAMCAANEMEVAIAAEIGEYQLLTALAFFCCSCVLFPFFVTYCVSARVRSETYAPSIFSVVVPVGALLGFGLLVLPILLQLCSKDLLRKGSEQSSKSNSKNSQRSRASRSSLSNISMSSLLAGMESMSPRTLSVYPCTVASVLVMSQMSVLPFGSSEALSFTSFTAAAILFFISITGHSHNNPGQPGDSLVRDWQRVSGSDGSSSYLFRSLVHKVRVPLKRLYSFVSSLFTAMEDLFIHARSNKASWQVLNFLVLQASMAVIELVYATLTEATGFISISADNFFCCVALAIGLSAIRATTKKPTATYTYGFSRIESVCGFINGVMLVYVAVLVVLEAFERLYEPESVAVGRSFVVCLFGMIGNTLGLYFFPPESRRENHNVQGIYLHIWANTLAFASMAISTAITAAIPGWQLIDVIIATLVGVGVVALAVPLVVRSARLLLLLAPFERVEALARARRRISETDGVIGVSGLRVWNLTPNCLIGSVRIEAAESYKGKDSDLLYKVRSIFASVGVPASQCTVQISRVESEKPTVTFHRRTRSGFGGETGIDLGLATIKEAKQQPNEPHRHPI